MELRLPSSYEDLTLRHLQVLETSQDPINRVQVVTGKTFAELRKMPQALIVEADAHLTALCKAEINRHQPIIELDGVEYGFIPDWESFTAGEWIDMETYTGDFWKAAHKAMAVLYRPIDRKWGDKYTIKPYTAKEDASVFLDMPAPLVSGALLFFWTTERELHLTLRSSLIQKATEVTHFLRSGNGIPSSTPWLVRTYYKWKRLLGSRWATSSPTSHS
jgi:hypothetical protein